MTGLSTRRVLLTAAVLLLSATTLVTVGDPAGGQPSSGIPVEELGIPAQDSTANQVNDAGVVAASHFYVGAESSFRWTEAGGVEELELARADSINASGTIVGAVLEADDSTNRAARWTETGGTQELSGLDPSTSSIAYDINDEGVIVGTYGRDAFRWSDRDGLGRLESPATSITANGINNEGTIVGRYGDGSSTNDQAYRWTMDGGIEALGDLGGGHSAAYAINADGTIVGHAKDQDGVERAFRWTEADGMQALAGLDGAFAMDINDHGTIVGYTDDGLGAHQAFRWTEASGVEILTDLDGDQSLAYGVNNHETIVGSSMDAHGNMQAVRWLPEKRPGVIRVETEPAVASQITIDGEYANTWAVNGLQVPSGTHEVCFSDTADHFAPDCQTVTVQPWQETLVTGEFTEKSYLKVTTDPPMPGQISIDGNPANNWGVWTALPAGDYEVCFGDVEGARTPDCEIARVGDGKTTEVVGEYSRDLGNPGPSDLGMLRVTTSPAVPSQITVDGHVADTWGLDWLQLPYGVHEVCFGDVPGFETPDCETVTVTSWLAAEVTGEFAEKGYLQVSTDPGVPSQISVDGIARDGWGLYTEVPVGTHEVCFGAIGSHDPGCESVDVTAGQTTSVIGDFGG